MFEHFHRRVFCSLTFFYIIIFPQFHPNRLLLGKPHSYLLYGYNNLQYTKLYNKHVSKGFRVQKKKEMRNFEAIHQLVLFFYIFLGSFLSFFFNQQQFFLCVCFFCVFSFYYPFFGIFAAA